MEKLIKTIIDMQYGLTLGRQGMSDVLKSIFRDDVWSYGQRDSGSQTCKGRLAFRGILNAWYTYFPNLTLSKINVSQTAKHQFISRYVLTGNHEGVFGKIDPTGKPVAWAGYATMTLDSYGKISMYGFDLDMPDLVNQLTGGSLTPDPIDEHDHFRKERLTDYLRQLGTSNSLLTKQETICLTFYLMGYSAKYMLRNSLSAIAQSKPMWIKHAPY